MVCECFPMNSLTVFCLSICFWAHSIASEAILEAVSLSSASPTKVRPGSAPIFCAAEHNRDGSIAASLRRLDFSTSSVTSSLQSSFVLSSIILHMLLVIGISTFSVYVTSAVVLPSLRRTTLDTASTSSITKMISLNPSFTGTLSPSMLYFWSKTIDASSALVEILAKGTLTIDLPVSWAKALIIDVFPVPGGPCNNNPNLFGYPLIAYFPVLFVKLSTMFKIVSFSLKNRLSKVFSSLNW
mmetsp:Transcript_4075/g.6226  ORF Transcript_4075/g.6226 Transcript_4075/m.6226 type:complete len:241 (-) Transcript_4075:54-776(-)